MTGRERGPTRIGNRAGFTLRAYAWKPSEVCDAAGRLAVARASGTRDDASMNRRTPEPRAQERPRSEASWAKRLAAETLGTFALVFVAAGADVMAAVAV